MLPSLHSKSPLELVKLAAETHAAFKPVGARLAKLPPSEEAARWLAAAFHRGDAPPWMTAYLLGQNGHVAGYETAKQILLAGPGQLAEGYAGPALARIDASRARTDLPDILRTGTTRRIREGAAYGLDDLGGKKDVAAITGALRDGLIGELAAWGILAAHVTAQQIQAMLEDPEPRIARAALEILVSYARPELPVASADTRRLAGYAAARVKLHPRTRRGLGALLANPPRT